LIDLDLMLQSRLTSVVTRVIDEVFPLNQFEQTPPVFGVGAARGEVHVIVWPAGLAGIEARGHIVAADALAGAASPRCAWVEKQVRI
jgi:hypothetical protein